MVGKLACITVSLPKEQQVLSEQGSTNIPTEPKPEQKKHTYTLHHTYGKRLSEKEADYVEKQIAEGETDWVADDENDPTRKTYICKKDGFVFEIRPIKEV